MKDYKVSIVLPVYNGEQYLSLAIESILRQTYTNYELIIIDDCSKDDSYKIAKEYEKRNTQIIVKRNKVNKKLPRSLNAGFRLASGDLYTWTSDDNLLMPETIEKMVEVFKQKTEVDFVYADIIPIDETGCIKKMPYLNGEIDEIYVKNPVLACFLYKKEIQENLVGYNPNKFLYEDYDFWIRVYEAGFRMYHLKRKIYYYRFHENSLTYTKRKESDKIQIELLKKNFFKETKIKNKIAIIKKLVTGIK